MSALTAVAAGESLFNSARVREVDEDCQLYEDNHFFRSMFDDGEAASESDRASGRANLAQDQAVQASHHGQGRESRRLQDLTFAEYADAVADSYADDEEFDLAYYNQPDYQEHFAHSFTHEDGDANMLLASGAPQPSPLDHDGPQHAPSEGPLSPAPPAAADMEGAASTLAATPDAPAATAPPALSDLSAGEGSTLPTPDVSLDTTAGNALPTLDAPNSLAQHIPINMHMAVDMNLPLNMNMPLNMNGLDMAPDLMPMDMDFPAQDPADQERLTAFARLRFDDGSYYMHTYQIILGRNLDLARRDMRRLARADMLEAQGREAAAVRLREGGREGKERKRGRRGAPSVISEKGGIVSARVESMPLEYQQRRHPSQSASAGSHQNGEAAEEKPAERAPQEVIMQAFPERPDQFDGHVPEDPHDCPLVPIHPQNITEKTGNQGPKGISRRHAKIFYDFDEAQFCIEVLGNNGLFHDSEYYKKGAVIPLDHGDHITIGAVNMQFLLPDIALTEEQRLRQESGSRPMSFSFENGHGEMESDLEMSSDSEGQQSINPRQVYYHPVDSEIESEDDMNEDDDMDEYEEPAPKQKIKLKLKAPRPRPRDFDEDLPPRKKSKKELKKLKKRKHREREERDYTPEESPTKKAKKIRPPPEEPVRTSPTKESKAMKAVKETKEATPVQTTEPKAVKEAKEPKEAKEKVKVSTKAPSKTPAPDEATPTAVTKETPVKDKPEVVKAAPTDSPPLVRKPLEAEIEAGGEIEGLITEEMALQHNLPRSLVGQVVEKRKGPGRPPKDGIMSKRQRSQLIKQAKEIERAKAAGIDPADIPAPSIKPKLTKRKDSNTGDGEGDDILESTEKGDGTIMGDKKQAKPIKPPRTPSPEMRIEDYSEEQLQRPSANYVVLIHEAISSSPNGQMNLQQIYNYIEKKYTWYKFKTTTSGWQSSVRHNLGQHDAFVKGDKEGKGFNWRINPEVSIEKERRKRQVSPPVNHAQRPQYYPPPNGYPSYPPQPGYPYHPGMPPPGMPQAPPRLPPSMMAPTPRLPPSLTRDANTATPAAPQGAPPPSPYASPWAGGNTAGSPPAAPMPPRPYPQPPAHGTPPVSSAAAGSSGQYGVLYPTSAPPAQNGHPAPSPYGGPYANAGASPYGAAPGRPYAPYPPQMYPQSGTPGPPGPQGPQSQSPVPPQSQPPPQPSSSQGSRVGSPVPNAHRYPPTTNRDLIRNLEAFRQVYLSTRVEPGEDRKVDNAIKAFIDTSLQASLTEQERQLLTAISAIPNLFQYRANPTNVKPEDASTQPPPTSTAAAGTAAAIAADAAASTTPTAPSSMQPQPQQPPQVPQPSVPSPVVPATPGFAASEPHKFTPNMTTAPAAAPRPVASLPPTHRPSVEPLTPVPGSPAVQNDGTPLAKRSVTEITAADLATKDADKEDDKNPAEGTPSVNAE